MVMSELVVSFARRPLYRRQRHTNDDDDERDHRPNDFNRG